jgi:DNA-binding CsgD family transcriptional regulator
VKTALPDWPLIGRGRQIETFTELLQSRERAGMIVFGPAGVGKTRLAEECRRIGEMQGYCTERTIGATFTQSLPLSSAAALLPAGMSEAHPDGNASVAAMFEQIRRTLDDRLDGRRMVLVADDIHRFDPASLSLVAHLVNQQTIFLVGTVRTGDPLPDLVTSLWRSGGVARFDLGELDGEDFDTLLHLALGGALEAGARLQLWSMSQGNPLYVHELVMGALEHQILAEHEGVWHLEGPLPRSDRLDELVAERMGSLDADGRNVVELLSLCQPLPVDYVATIAGREILERLEESGRIIVALGRDEVTLGHPLFGEVIREQIPSLRSREMLRREADRLQSRGELSPVDQLRLAEWRLTSEGRADSGILLDAAYRARFAQDFRAVRRFVEAVPATDRGPAGSLLLGEALYELGSFEESERTLATEQAVADDGVYLRIVVTRTKNLHWGLCDPSRALEVNAKARPRISSRALLDELASNEAAIHMFSGHPDLALDDLTGVKADDVRGRTVRAIVLSPALACAGRTGEAVEVAEAGFADHTDLGDELAIAHPGTHIVNQVFALTEAGRLADAGALARLGAEVAAADHVPIAQIWFALNQGRIALIEGKTATARRFFAEGAGLATAHHFAGPLRMALAGLATSDALLGDVSGAQGALDRQDGLPAFGFVGPEQELGPAWTLAACAQPVRAAEHFRRAAARAADTGHRTSEASLLHDLLRACGQNESSRLAELAAMTDSPLVHARARHVEARLHDDPDRLVAVADEFVALGARLLAAEALASAVDGYRRAGNQRAATAASHRSSGLAAGCEGTRSPDLLVTGSTSPLSDREREVARLAANGLPSKEIAARLFLSLRTVNNHLQRAYTKLGVTSRADLARALEE